ncbi:MAG: UvrD-helicase domain-containing protein [Planctomycetaceae bacterium]|jgi:ATP-dependent exoDNAse (exonuclease V) beta subunit|nr:UvrD-helicase domain-containing protein [Planctomycetaceae bacterium]
MKKKSDTKEADFFANTIIRASAGSGKTFRLSNTFLQIVFDNDVNSVVDRILASTFTVKAAGEILERILQNISGAALDVRKRENLASHLNCSLDETELQCRLAILAKNLYRLQIGTLDSYFNKIARAFLFEIGMPPGWKIINDAEFERVLVTAVGEVLAESEHNDAKKLFDMFNKGEQKQTVMTELVELASNLLSIVRGSSPKCWDNEQLLRTELTDDEIQHAITQLENAELPRNKTKNKNDVPPPNSNFVKARDRVKPLAANYQWKEFINDGFVGKIIDGSQAYYKIPIEGDLLESLETLVQHASAVEINKIVGQTRATHGLLKLIIGKLDRIMFRTGGFRFEDVTRKLADSKYDFGNRTDSVKHRLNTATEHLLLDEFQDTSMPQWKIIKPLSKQVAGKAGGTFFCVGDIKQAIYGWRGGVAEIFDTVKTEIENVDETTMEKTRRCTQPVVDAVNRVFLNLTSNDAITQHENDCGLAGDIFNKHFQEHSTANNDDGYCTLEVVPNDYKSANVVTPTNSVDYVGDDIDDYDNDDGYSGGGDGDENDRLSEKTLSYVIDKVKELRNSKPNAEIGVLVRGNKQISTIIAGLKTAGVEASEEGGNPLSRDSLAVQHIRSAMIFADHPGDTIVRFHLENSPLGACLKITNHKSDLEAMDAAAKLRKELMSDGYGKVVERLSKEMLPLCDEHENGRLEQLVELAYKFQNLQDPLGIRTRAFVDAIDKTKIESKTPAKVRVMTVHASKGLEFDIVVLPFIEKKAAPLFKSIPNNKVVVGREKGKQTESVETVLRYVGKEMQALLPSNYRDIFAQRIQHEVEESLAVLYVAMTRAKYELALIVPQKNKPKSGADSVNLSATFADVLRASFCGENKDKYYESGTVYCTGNRLWYEKSKLREDAKPDTAVDDVALKPLKETEWQRNVKRDTPSSHHGKYEYEYDETAINSSEPRENREDAMLRGTAIHACFEKAARWLDDESDAVTDEQLTEIITEAKRGKQGTIDDNEIIKKFREGCGKEEIKAALSKQQYGADVVELECERRFVIRKTGKGKDVIVRGSIDRLVVLRDASGKVTAVEIFDFKTDKGDVNKLTELYKEQLNLYRDCIVKLCKISDKTIVKTKLIFVTHGKVVEV